MPPLKKIVLRLFVGAMVATVTHLHWRWFALRITPLKSVLYRVLRRCGLCFRYVFKEEEY